MNYALGTETRLAWLQDALVEIYLFWGQTVVPPIVIFNYIKFPYNTVKVSQKKKKKKENEDALQGGRLHQHSDPFEPVVKAIKKTQKNSPNISQINQQRNIEGYKY